MIYVVRHAVRSDRSGRQERRKYKGVISDPPISFIGQDQAYRSAENLLKEINKDSRLIFLCSPYQRCILTANIFYEVLSSKFQIEKNAIYIEEIFREIEFNHKIPELYQNINCFHNPAFLRDEIQYFFNKLDKYNKFRFIPKKSYPTYESNFQERVIESIKCVMYDYVQRKEKENIVFFIFTHSFFHRVLGNLNKLKNIHINCCAITKLKIENGQNNQNLSNDKKVKKNHTSYVKLTKYNKKYYNQLNNLTL